MSSLEVKSFVFPRDVSDFSNIVHSHLHMDKWINIFFTVDVDSGECPFVVGQILTYIDEYDECVGNFNVMAFQANGHQFANINIDTEKCNVNDILKILRDVTQDGFSFGEWLENPSMPSIIADSVMNATYITHMLKIFGWMNMQVRDNIPNYGKSPF